MHVSLARFCLVVPFIAGAAFLAAQADSQEAATPQATPQAAAPEVPRGIEVMARGPVHEAFAAPFAEAKPTAAIPKKPPASIEEMPPEDRPEGDVVWIGGYWSYDDERQDFLWVSGCWRVKPENKEWVPGYWREVSAQWQWIPGFWANAAPAAGKAQEVTYYPEPPPPPHLAPPGDPPQPDMFYVPGYYQWTGSHYIWRAGYWSRVRPGYVYVAAHYRWTPSGYVFIPGYWDYAVARRGVLYAPVVVDTAIVPVSYVYTPVYAVSDGIVLDAMFVRPAYGHYYFGDYYGPDYATRGYVTTVVYSRTYYEPIFVYQRWEYRDRPRWYEMQVNIVFERNAGRMPVPPRTLVQQQTMIVQNNTTVNNYFINNSQTTVNNTQVNNTKVVNAPVLQPAKTLMASKGIPTTTMDVATRSQVKQASQAVQVAAATERRKTELAPPPAGASGRPRTAALSVPTTPVAPRAPAALTPQSGIASGQATPPAKLGPTLTNPALHPSLGSTNTANQHPMAPSGLGKGPTESAKSTNPHNPPPPGTIAGNPTTSGNTKGTAAPVGPLPHPMPVGTTVTNHPSGTAVPKYSPPPPAKKSGDDKKKDRS
jgi:hypothetical protein